MLRLAMDLPESEYDKPRRRYATLIRIAGVMPQRPPNARKNERWLSKPDSAAISASATRRVVLRPAADEKLDSLPRNEVEDPNGRAAPSGKGRICMLYKKRRFPGKTPPFAGHAHARDFYAQSTRMLARYAAREEKLCHDLFRKHGERWNRHFDAERAFCPCRRTCSSTRWTAASDAASSVERCSRK